LRGPFFENKMERYGIKSSQLWVFISVFFLAAFLFLFKLGYFPLKDYDEAHYGSVVLDSIDKGSFLTLFKAEKPWVDKPPLLFWLNMAGVKFFGASEFILRFPSALFGLLSVFLTYLFTAYLTKNKFAGFVSALVLLTTAEFIYASREFRLDSALAFFLLLAAYGFIRSMDNPRWLLLFGAAVGMGFLSKSVVVLLIFPIIFIFSLFYNRWSWIKRWEYWLGLALAAVIAAPWVLYEYATLGKYFIDGYFGHQLGRMGKEILGGGNTSYFYYLKNWFKLVWPWSYLFIIGGLFWVFNSVRRTARIAAKTPVQNFWRAFGSTFVIVSFIIVVFSFIQTRLFYYIEPIYPFMAVNIAVFFVILQMKVPRLRELMIVCLSFLFIIGLANTVIQIYELKELRSAEYAYAVDEKNISLILNKQKYPVRLYTSNHYMWDTFQYYTRGSVQISTLKMPADINSFFLAIPNQILQFAELEPSLSARARISYKGDKLTLFEIASMR